MVLQAFFSFILLTASVVLYSLVWKTPWPILQSKAILGSMRGDENNARVSVYLFQYRVEYQFFRTSPAWQHTPPVSYTTRLCDAVKESIELADEAQVSGCAKLETIRTLHAVILGLFGLCFVVFFVLGITAMCSSSSSKTKTNANANASNNIDMEDSRAQGKQSSTSSGISRFTRGVLSLVALAVGILAGIIGMLFSKMNPYEFFGVLGGAEIQATEYNVAKGFQALVAVAVLMSLFGLTQFIVAVFAKKAKTSTPTPPKANKTSKTMKKSNSLLTEERKAREDDDDEENDEKY